MRNTYLTTKNNYPSHEVIGWMNILCISVIVIFIITIQTHTNEQ